MPKKTTRTARTGQGQRSKEEQWRKRMAAQSQRSTAGAVTEPELDEGTPSPVSGTPYVARDTAPVAPTVRTPSASQTRTQERQAATQRRSASTARSSRLRAAAQMMSIDEEMHYVRTDIRRLVILTVICMAVLIALSFIIPS